MAFMEKPPAGKVLLDDTVPLTAAIEASQSLQSHTLGIRVVGMRVCRSKWKDDFMEPTCWDGRVAGV